jgi:hypothetical protein
LHEFRLSGLSKKVCLVYLVYFVCFVYFVMPRSGMSLLPLPSLPPLLRLPRSGFYTTIELKLEQKAGDPESRWCMPAAGTPLLGIFSTETGQFSLDSAPVN